MFKIGRLGLTPDSIPKVTPIIVWVKPKKAEASPAFFGKGFNALDVPIGNIIPTENANNVIGPIIAIIDLKPMIGKNVIKNPLKTAIMIP